MWNVIDLSAEQKSKEQFEASNQAAIDHFEQQQSAIQGIKESQGYKEIKRFRQTTKEGCIERLETMKPEEMGRVQWALHIAKQFLSYLEVREEKPKKLK